MKPEATIGAEAAHGRKKTGLIVLLVVLVIMGALAALIFRLPQKMGLIKGVGAKMTAETPERIPAGEILAEAETKGFKSEGADLYVFPKPESADAVLYAVLDLSKGFAFSRVNSYHPVVDTLVLLGSGEKLKEYAVTHIGLEFRDEGGKTLMVVAATAEDIRALVAGGMSEADFTAKTSYRFHAAHSLNRAYNPF